jgi:two-component system, OmpR family, response regulator
MRGGSPDCVNRQTHLIQSAPSRAKHAASTGRIGSLGHPIMRLLLVEDDLPIGQSLLRALTDAGYEVEWVRDGLTGRTAIEGGDYLAVLLDLSLPGMSGLDVLKSARASGKEVPVLILTARDDLDTRVRGLDLGADDYVLKPFDVPELLARLRAVVRRKAGYAASRLGDEALCLDLDKRTLSCNGLTATLTSREFSLMVVFFERPGTIFSRSQLEDRLYGWRKEVDSNAIDVLIYAIRKKFGQSIIRNVRGIGWTLILTESAGRQSPIAQP